MKVETCAAVNSASEQKHATGVKTVVIKVKVHGSPIKI